MGLLDKLFGKKNKEDTKVVYTPEEYEKYITSPSEVGVFDFDPKYANQEETLLEIYGPARELDKHISILIIADCRGNLEEIKFKRFIENRHYDICLLLGDFSGNDVDTIIKYVDNRKIYALLGNHDYKNYIRDNGLKDLNGRLIEVNGVTFTGIQGTFKYKPIDFPSFTQKGSIDFLKDTEPVDILVSHDTKFNSEAIEDPAHQGLFGITYYIYKNRVPYNIHGHLHEPFKKVMLNGTNEISSYMYEIIDL